MYLCLTAIVNKRNRTAHDKQNRRLTTIDNHLSRFQHLQEIVINGATAEEIDYTAQKWVMVGHKLQRTVDELAKVAQNAQTGHGSSKEGTGNGSVDDKTDKGLGDVPTPVCTSARGGSQKLL